MTKVTTRSEIGLLVVIGEHHLEAEVEVGKYTFMDRTIDRIIGEYCKTVTEMTLGEETIGRCKVIEVRIIEVDVETITEVAIEIVIETIVETIIEMTM